MLLDVFVQAFRHQFLPVFTEITLPAMEAFGGYDLHAAIVAAASGALLAVAVLYRLAKLVAARWHARQPERASAISARLQPYALALMLFVSTPPGFAIAFAAGVLQVPVKWSLPIAFAGLVIAYGAAYG